MDEKTFVMLKPESVAGGHVGEILMRVEKAGFRLQAMKLVKVTLGQAEKLYEMHVGKSFYGDLINHIMSGPTLPMVVEGKEAVKRVRGMVGATNPEKAEAGTIRRDFGLSVTKNAIHAADSPENAEREIKIFFKPEEILTSYT